MNFSRSDGSITITYTERIDAKSLLGNIFFYPRDQRSRKRGKSNKERNYDGAQRGAYCYSSR